MDFGATNFTMPQQVPWLNSLESLAEYRERARSRLLLCRDTSAEELACPKPHRVATGMQMAPSEVLAKPFRRLRSSTSLPVEGEVGHEILDILYSKVNNGDDSPNAYLHGSPPRRASNPMIHDTLFTQERAVPAPVATPQRSSRGSPAVGGNSPAKSNSSAKISKPFIRIEGFASANVDSNRGVVAYA